MLKIAYNANAQAADLVLPVVRYFTAAGSYPILIPGGSSSVRVQLWGGGGAGATGSDGIYGGGGGAGGDYAESTIANPTPGNHALVVGAPGSDSTWDSGVVRAVCGTSAVNMSGAVPSGASVGSIVRRGGAGHDGNAYALGGFAGGGGGSAGPSANGNAGGGPGQDMWEGGLPVIGGGPGGRSSDDGSDPGGSPISGPGGGASGCGSVSGALANVGWAGQAVISISVVGGPGLGSLSVDQTLETAVFISLFTNRLAATDDTLPNLGGSRQGWWADAYADQEGTHIGSRLWLLGRSTNTGEIVNDARTYVREALQWLVDDGIADRVDCNVEVKNYSAGALLLAIQPLVYKLGQATPYTSLWQMTITAP